MNKKLKSSYEDFYESIIDERTTVIKDEAYPEEMLIACQNGKPCSYGICDECPNTRGNNRSDEDDEE